METYEKKYILNIPILTGDWIIETCIGHGGYSYVYDCSIINTDTDTDTKIKYYKSNFNNFGNILPNKHIIKPTDKFVIKVPRDELVNNELLFENFNFHLQLMILNLVPRVIDYGLYNNNFCYIMDKYMLNGNEYFKIIAIMKDSKNLCKIYFENVITLLRKLASYGICTMDIKNSNIVVNHDTQYRLLDIKLIDIDVLFTNISSDKLTSESKHEKFIYMCIIWYVYSMYGRLFNIFSIDCFELFKKYINIPLTQILQIQNIIDLSYNIQGRYSHPIQERCHDGKIHNNIKCYCDTMTYSQILCLGMKFVDSYETKHFVDKEMFSKCITKILWTLISKKHLYSCIFNLRKK
jgi:hypothetical protein